MTEPRFDLQPGDLVISLDDLWLRCFALGTMNTATELEAFLRGVDRPTRHEYNVIAVALNEYFVEIGSRRVIPYSGDDSPIAGHKPARRLVESIEQG
jgi:hypothetical protein